MLGYAIWSSLRLSPLGGMFPLSVAIVTLVLCAVLVGMLTRGSVENRGNVDLEYGAETERSDLLFTVAWFAALIVTTAAFGFILGTLVFFLLFLRLKAQASWQRACALSAGAIVVLIVFTNLLFVELPSGMLSLYLDIPWLLGQAR